MESEKLPSKYGGAWRGAALSATILLISTGLCGVNEALFSRYGAISGGTPEPPRSAGLSGLLIFTGSAELFGMAFGAIGLAIAAVTALVKFIKARYAALGRDEDLE